MKKVRISILLLFVLLLLAFSVFAAQINSTSYKQSVIVSVGGENVSSPSYKMNIAIGIINAIINSTSFINRLGFFHTLLLANDQPCTLASQCEGGFCCSSLCKSSACPSPGGGETGGGEGGAAAAGGGGAGGGAFFVCNQDWECSDWSACIEESQTRQCDFVKVPQHTQNTACPSSANPPKTTQECEIGFSVNPSSIKEHIKLGAAKTETITIKNNGDGVLNFNLNVLTVGNFVLLSDSSFSLDAAQEKNVEVNIIGKKLGSYLGEIEVESTGAIKSVKSIIVIVEVESEQVLFDAKIDIPSAYKEVEAGKELKAQITLLNVGPPRKVDVTTTYIIKDKLGNVVYEESETFAVEKQTSFIKSFKVPQNLKPGEYLAIIEVRYENSFAVSSELFKVLPKKETAIQKTVKSNATLLFVLVIFLGLMFLFISLLIQKVKIFNKPKFKKGK